MIALCVRRTLGSATREAVGELHLPMHARRSHLALWPVLAIHTMHLLHPHLATARLGWHMHHITAIDDHRTITAYAAQKGLARI